MNKGTVGCAIPALGRVPLLHLTIQRLRKQTYPVSHIVIISDDPEVMALAKEMNVDFVGCENRPLGRKWQVGYMHLHQKYNTDHFLVCGSSDWLSDNWVETMMQYVDDTSVGMIGTAGCHFYDIGKEQRRLCYWGGYWDEHRKGEPIGIGRMVFRPALERMKWEMFDQKIDHSLDWSTYKKILSLGLIAKCIEYKDIAACSISHYAWANKHSFDREAGAPTSQLIENYSPFMDELFPEHNLIG